MSATRPTHDDRFVAPVETNRKGAHRAAPNPYLAFAPHAAVGLVLVLAIGLAVSLILGNTRSVDDDSTTTNTTSTTASTSGSSSGSSSTKKATTAAATVSKTVTVTVLNSTSTKGLAGKAAKKLTSAGWTKAAAAFTAATAQDTTVYYGRSKQKATATAIAEALGVGTVKLDATTATAGAIVVIVGTDFSS